MKIVLTNQLLVRSDQRLTKGEYTQNVKREDKFKRKKYLLTCSGISTDSWIVKYYIFIVLCMLVIL